MYLYEGLGEQVASYLSPEQAGHVKQAFLTAYDAHDGQMRSSGDPYITHPIAVARILADMRLDYQTIMGALLHDVIEDTSYTKDDLAELFGSTVADLVEGVSKLDKIKFKSVEDFQAENYRKMIMAMTMDIRVILIKLADRTHNMRTLGSLRPDKRRRIARETLEIYSPIANRLGIHDIKNELEDLGFLALHPMRYRALTAAVKSSRNDREAFIDRIKNQLTQRLEKVGIECDISGRGKHLYSIYKKMKNKELNFKEIMDIYAFRLIVNDIDTCYRVLGVAHNLFKPIETRFKDYIAIPKTNGYQSLHTSLVGPQGIPIEIQIRTKEMDSTADKGVAAHWSYKSSQSSSNASNTSQQRAQQWMQSLLELQQSAGNSHEFIENVKTELFPEEIYVFTPDGKIIELPMGATAVDFAYAVHTDVGNSCVGAKIDRKPYPLNKALDTGQTIEVVTSPGIRPNATWLNFVVTGKARLGIRNFLKKQRSEEALSLGKRLLGSALGEKSIDKIPEEAIQIVLDEIKVESLDKLYFEIGMGNLMCIAIARRLLGNLEEQGELKPIQQSSQTTITGTEGMVVSYAKCCCPIPGDDIIAYISQGKGLTVHQVECGNIKGWEREPAHYFSVKWGEAGEKLFNSRVFVEVVNHQGVLAKLTNGIASTNANILGISTEEKEGSFYVITLEISVHDRIHLANIMRKLRIMPEVQKVYRRK